MATDRQTALKPSLLSASEIEGVLTASEIEATVDWLEAQQKPSGEIAWMAGGKMDPWDHVHSAMGLMAFGRISAALRAFAFMVETQEDDGGWAAERRGGSLAAQLGIGGEDVQLVPRSLHTGCPSGWSWLA